MIVTKFDYESSYKKIMDECINNIRKMDEMALQQMIKEIGNKIKEAKKK